MRSSAWAFFRRRLAFAQPRRKNARICGSPRLPCRAAARQNRRMLPTRPGGRPAASPPAAQQIRALCEQLERTDKMR